MLIALASSCELIYLGLVASRPNDEIVRASMKSLVIDRAVDLDAVVIDVDSEFVSNPLTMLRGIRHNCLLVAYSLTREMSRLAIGMGIKGVVLKGAPANELNAIIDRTARGENCWDNQLMHGLIVDKMVVLSRRQAELADLVAQGLSNKLIANAMGISEGTVKVYMSTLFHKLHCASRHELAMWIRRNVVAESTGNLSMGPIEQLTAK